MFDPPSLHKVWKWLCVYETEATIYYHYVSAPKLRKTCRRNNGRWVDLAYPSGSQSIGDTQTKVEKGKKWVAQRRVKLEVCSFNVISTSLCPSVA